VTTQQMRLLADVAEEYAVGVLHVTTRQDFQCHFIDINDSSNMFRRLAEVGITTREACGNAVRNVTCCPYAGVCGTEPFDVTTHAWAMAFFLLRHPDAQNFGRKFKIAFSGCEDTACGLIRLHDLGAIARVQGGVQGFEVWIGGGLGPLPYQAKKLHDFVPAEEMLPLAQAIGRVFALYGEKANRAKARMKFLVEKLGFDEFARRVAEERTRLTYDPAWESQIEAARKRYREQPLKPPSKLSLPDDASPELRRWLDLNVKPQHQDGYSTVEIFLPLGDISSDQMRALANVCDKYVDNTIRTTVSQNLLVRWVSNADLPAFYQELVNLRLHETGAARLRDVTACPGTDSCKLGISASRGLAAVLHEKFSNGMSDLADRDDLKIKISGCFNSCGQHHIADFGFFGSVQRKGQHSAPVFQVVLGGTTEGNAKTYGLAVGKVPSKNVPDAIRRLTEIYDSEKQGEESFSEVVERIGRAKLKEELEPFAKLPAYEEDPEYYHDNRQTWAYTKSVGVGECAGEVVDQAEFLLEEADRLNLQATVALEKGLATDALEKSLAAQNKAADALLFTKGLWLSDRYDRTGKFRELFYDNGLFYKPFADNYFRSVEEGNGLDLVAARRRVEEATLFIEAAQDVYSKA
jgi:sulfite reductase (ferredoxin)